MRRAGALLLAMLLAAPVAAQEIPLTAGQLLDRLVGGTAAFVSVPDGAPVGVEHFPSRKRSFWQETGGTCVNGEMTVEDGALCFRYEDAPEVSHCWTAFKLRGRLFVRSTRTGSLQEVTPVAGLPFDCVDGLTS